MSRLFPYVVGAICSLALLMVCSAFSFRTRRYTGAHIWEDSVRFWNAAAIFCGVTILITMYLGVRTGLYGTSAVVAVILFSIPAVAAEITRHQLERSFEVQLAFENQDLATGLFVVPWVGLMGAGFGMLLGVLEYNEWAKLQTRWPLIGPPGAGV